VWIFEDVSITPVKKHQIQVDVSRATATVVFDNAESVEWIMEKTNGVLKVRKHVELLLSVVL